VATKTFQLQAVTVIKSANLELDAAQLEALAAAEPHLQAVCAAYPDQDDGSGTKQRDPDVAALEPVSELLRSIASLVSQTGTIQPKRKPPVRRKKNPTAGKST